MKISILVPIYCVEEYIGKCVKSLFEQTYKEIEYVFVNDCTPDNSVVILETILNRYPDRKDAVKIISHKVNSGLAAARISGLTNATGDYIMFVDSDDYLDIDAVEVLVKEAQCGNFDIVSAGIIHIFSNGHKFVDNPLRTRDKMECLKMMLERSTFLNVFPRLYKRILFEKIDNPFVVGINYGEDYLMTTRVFYYADRVSYINRPVYNYMHTNAESYTYQFKRINFENLLKVDSIIYDFYQKVGEKDLLDNHQVGRLKLKSEQLIMYLRSKNQISDDYNFIKCNLLEKQTEEYLCRLPLQDRLVLKLSERLPRWIMTIYVRIGYGIKQFVKQAKVL